MKRFLTQVGLVYKLFLFTLVVLVPVCLRSQNTGIQKRIYLAKSNNAYSRDIIETTPGNFVLIGQSIDSVAGQLESHLTLAGIDNDGNLNWRKSYGSNKFTYTALMGSSRYIIKHNGFLYSAMLVNDSAGKTPGIFIKFNFNGDTIWQKKFYQPNPAAQSFFTSVYPSIDNGFLITGAIQTNTPGYNGHPTVGLYLLKTDMNGNKLWDKVLYKSNLDQTQAGIDIVQDSASKRIIIVGYQENNSGGSANVLILDSLGSILIQKGSGPDWFGDGLMNIIKTKDGNFLSSGIVSYPIVNTNPTSRSFLVKFDTNANIIFGKEYDTISIDNGISRIAELTDGHIITGGYFETINKYNNGLNTVSRIMKHDKNGNLIWKKYFDNYTDYHNTDALLGMCVSSNNDIVFTSFCECPEPAPIQFIFYRTDTNYCDVNAVGCYMTGIPELENTLEVNSIELYPNPAASQCKLKMKTPYTLKGIEVYNLLGELIFKEYLKKETEYDLNIAGYSSGIYYVRVVSDKSYVEKKLVVVK